MADAERLLSESLAEQKPKKPLKPARSQAELVALRQRWIQIALTGTNCLVACLTCLKVFGIL